MTIVIVPYRCIPLFCSQPSLTIRGCLRSPSPSSSSSSVSLAVVTVDDDVTSMALNLESTEDDLKEEAVAVGWMDGTLMAVAAASKGSPPMENITMSSRGSRRTSPG